VHTLGSPASASESGSSGARETRQIWRKDGVSIDATFLGSDRLLGAQTFKQGSLLWFEVSRAL
jgi:hypothetical protein